MTVSTVFRQLLGLLIGVFAWWYFYAVEPFILYPYWVNIIIAAFLISLVIAIVAENMVLGLMVVILVYVAYGPGFAWSVNQFLPLFGGMVAASAVWKII
ncbi:MAG: hypothetical protein RO469_14520 [Thermincola sp.]|jgi:hypothetical protein|nr:hypothetical protein [Thermincola sp.]MDT3704541.1 hypothetical protein [Thermincola sp.]